MSRSERARIRLYVTELRAVQQLGHKRHECPEDPDIKKKKAAKKNNSAKRNRNVDNDRRIIEMEIYGIKAPLPTTTQEIDAD